VTGQLRIDGALELESLDGLDNLTEVERISVWGCAKLVDLRALSSLESVTGGCDFWTNEKLPTCEAEWLQGVVEKIGSTCSFLGTDDEGVCQ
jgi:hypothetical protein